jgi:hypothetical protein
MNQLKKITVDMWSIHATLGSVNKRMRIMISFVLVISVMMGGVFEPDRMRLYVTSNQCQEELLTLQAMNRALAEAGQDRILFGECREP